MKKAKRAKTLFMAMLEADVPRIAVENPVPGSIHELPPYSQIIQPFMFGDEIQRRIADYDKILSTDKGPLVVLGMISQSGEKGRIGGGVAAVDANLLNQLQ